MIMFGKIVKLALIFSEYAGLKKEASIASDLAIRIMHSLIPYSVDHPDQAKSTMVLLTQKHLIGVAERYMERAAKIITDEMSWSRGQNAHKRIENALKAKNYLAVAKIGFQEFEIDQNWDTGYGGKKWSEFCKYLVNLGISINAFNSAKTEDGKLQASNDIVINMNVLDGLTHNTGSFSEKMINNEADAEATEGFTIGEIYENKMRKLLRMMDAKQLTHKEDVLPFIKKYMYNNPDSFLYREYFSKLLNQAKPDPKRTEAELDEIKDRKKLINVVVNIIDFTIDRMQNDFKNNNIKHYNDYISSTVDLINNRYWKSIRNKLINIINKYNIVAQNYTTEDDIENLHKYFEQNKESPGQYIVILDWKTKYEMNCSNGKCTIGPIDNYDPTLMNKLHDFTQIRLDRSLFTAPLIEKLKDVISAAKEMRSLINQEYHLGLPELN